MTNWNLTCVKYQQGMKVRFIFQTKSFPLYIEYTDEIILCIHIHHAVITSNESDIYLASLTSFTIARLIRLSFGNPKRGKVGGGGANCVACNVDDLSHLIGRSRPGN